MKRLFSFQLNKRHDKRNLNPSVLERINRDENEDKIEIGRIIEEALNGQFGTVLNLIINGLIDEELMASQMNTMVSPDRVLGRVEMLNKLQDRLETCIATKRQLEEEIREDASTSVGAESIETVAGPQAV